MRKSVKRYTIKYVYAGYTQYATFHEGEDGKIIAKQFYPNYLRKEDEDKLPNLENVDNIEEILKLIKEFAYSNRAEMHLINGMPPKYYEQTEVKEYINNSGNLVKQMIEDKCIEFFKKYVVPILIKNNWYIAHSHMMIPVVIHKDENDEWDNVRSEDEFLLQYMCYDFTRGLGLYKDKIDMCPEHSKPIVNGFKPLIYNIPDEVVRETNLYIEF